MERQNEQSIYNLKISITWYYNLFSYPVLCIFRHTLFKNRLDSNNRYQNEFEFVDTTGHVWVFTDEELLIPTGTPIEATIKMFTNNTTDYIEDDIILDYEIKNEK